MNGANAVCEPNMPLPQILADLDALDKALCNLADEWATLYSKLDPVLPPSPPTEAESASGEDGPTRCRIAIRLDDFRERIDYLARYVRTTRSDIQL